MDISLNINNNKYFSSPKHINPSFGIKIPELETAIDIFISKTNNTPKEEKNLIAMIKKFANRIFQQESFIGSGCQNEVYDMGKYAFRIPKGALSNNENGTKSPLSSLSDQIIKNKDSFGIDSYYGEFLLQLGDLKILKNIGEHTPCGVPYSMLKNMSKEEICEYYFEKYFQKITKLPQSAFDKFAQDVEKIKKPKTIDFQNPNNTVISKDNRIILTDDLLNYNKYCGENSTAKLLRIFMLDISTDQYTPNYGKYINDAQLLFKKIILAGEKAELALSSGYEDNILIKEALSKCNANIKYDDFIKNISKINQSSESASDKLKETEKYLNKIFE